MEQIVIEFVGDTSKLIPAIDAIGQISPELKKPIEEMKRLSQESDKATAKIASNSKTVIKSFSDIDKGIERLVDTLQDEFMKGAQDALNEAGVSAEEFADALASGTDKAGKKSGSLKAQLRALKEEISRMEDAGLDGEKRFQQMTVEAAKLEDQIGDTAARVRALASDTANIDAAVQGLQVISSGYQFMTSAQALAGEENEDLQKSLVKLNAIMAFTSSIQQIYNALQQQTILVQKANIIWTGAQSVAQRIYATAVGQSTGAMRVFRTVMLGLGIGAVVAIIALAAEAMGLFSSSSDDATKSLKEQKEAADELVQSMEDIIDASARERAARKGGSDDIKRQLEILKAKGATSQQIFEKEQELRRKEIQELEIAGLSYERLREQRRASGQLTEQDEIAINDKILAINRQGKDKRNEILAAELEYNKKVQDEKLKKEQEAAEKFKQIREKNNQALFEIEQRRLQREQELNKGIADADPAGLNNRLAALQNYQSATLALIELQRTKELAAENLTGTQIKNINDKFDTDRLKALNDYQVRRLQIIQSANERIEQENRENLERLKADDEAAAAAPVNGIIDLYKGIAKAQQSSQAEALAGAEANYKKGVLNLQEYEAARTRILDDSKRAELGNEVNRLNAILQVRRDAGQDTADVEKELNDAREALRQADLEKYKKTEAEKTEATRKRVELLQAIEQAGLQVIGEAVDAIFSGQKAQRDAALQNSLQLLEQQRAKELDNKALTEQQKAEIEERYLQRQRQIKRQAAERDKQAQINAAVINGLLAVTNALATVKPFFPAAIIAASLAAATAGIQVAKIRAVPIPAFKKGTRKAPKGTALVGEEGPELIELSGGEKIYTYRQTQRVLEAWRGGRQASPDEILGIRAIPSVNKSLISQSMSIGAGGKLNIDYDKLGTVIAEKVAETMPEPVINQFSFDKDGFNYSVTNAGNRRRYLDSRYSFKG